MVLKKILVILDGASDSLSEGIKTPLESAEMPNLDFFVKNGKMGYMYPVNENTIPGSDNSLISIFGNDPWLCKRGIYEAIGAGIRLNKGDIAFRANFGSIENLKTRRVIDRRAGRTLTTREARLLAKDLNEKIKLLCKFEFKSCVQHRGVLVLRGRFSESITNIDPEWGDKSQEFRFTESFDGSELSKNTANIVNQFITEAFKILNNHPVNIERIKKGLLPANMIFLRGGGVGARKLRKYKGWMSINPMPLEIGISKESGMKVFSFEYPELKNIDSYRNLYDGLDKTIRFAIKTLKKEYKNYSGCYIQFKETDVPGHDNKPYIKREFLEIIDKEFFGFLKKFFYDKEIKIIVTCDHSTPCKQKAHSADPVPVLVFGEGSDASRHFCEKEAMDGSLGKIYGKEFIEKTGLDK